MGLTRYNLGKPVRLLTRSEASQVLVQVDVARERALGERGTPWCYAADEMFLIANVELPAETYYGDGGLLENGVGAVRRFLTDFDAGLASVPRMPGKRIRVVTAASMAPFLRERAGRLAEATSADVQIVETRNEFFGETVTVAGLLAGADIARALGASRPGDVVLLPAESLNADQLFIDSMPLVELTRALAPARVVKGFEVTAALRTVEGP